MSAEARAGRRGPWPRWAALAAALLAITLLGAALRLVDLNRLPPGAYLDETNPNILARDSLATGHFQIYYPESFGGYHAAEVYIALVWRWLTGANPYALRYGVAVWSILSLPVCFWALRAIFGLDEAQPRAAWLALAGTLIIASSAAYVINSRNAMEPVLPMPLVAATFGFLAQAVRGGRRRQWLLAGLALGLAQYTAITARFVPLAVALALAGLAAAGPAGRAAWRAQTQNLLLVAAASLAAALPLLAYFARHPEAILARAALTTGDTRAAGLAGLPGFLANSTWRTLGSLVLPGFGDVLPRQNLPGRPLFDAFLGLCLVVGVGLALRRLRRASHIVLLSWAAVLLTPAIITLVNNAPHFTRLILALPALAGLAAMGLAAIYDGLRARRSGLAVGVVGAGLCVSTLASAWAVFVLWPAAPALPVDFLAADWQAANLAADRSATQAVFLSPELLSSPDHTSFNWLLHGGPVRDFPGPSCLVYRATPDRPSTYVVLNPSDPRTIDRLTALFPAGRQQPAILHAPGQWADYLVFETPAGAAATPPQHAAGVRFGESLALLGYDLSASNVTAGGTLTVTLYWQALQPALADYSMFVHVYLPGGEVGAAGVSPQPVAQNDGAPCQRMFLTPRWQPGEVVVDERALNVPAGYAAPTAALGLGVYGWPSLVRLPVSGGAGLLPGNRLSLGTIAVGP